MRPGIDPKVDYAFKRLFGREQTRALLVHLLNALLKPLPGKAIIDVELLNPFSEQDALDDKLSIVDVKARDQSGRTFHIEMQLPPNGAFRGRVLYCWAKLHQQQLAAGDPYDALRPTISVCFTDFVLFPDTTDYVLAFGLRDAAHGLVFSDQLQLVTVELPKFNRSPDQLADPLEVWLYFLRHAATLDSAALPGLLDTPEIHRAMEELTVLSQNDVERERYEARLKLHRDELSRLHSAHREGLELGIEQGIEKGKWIGMIQTYQRLLKRPLSSEEQLRSSSADELQQLAQQLEQELLSP